MPGKAYKLAHVETYKSGVVKEVKDLKGPFKVLIYPPSLGREAFFVWIYSSDCDHQVDAALTGVPFWVLRFSEFW